MSKQLGVIKLKGNLGGISFYQSEGVSLARIANGPSKERIRSDSAFQRTRENNVEFGGSATAAKALRTSLLTAIASVADSKLTSRLTKLLKQINAKGTGARGQRSILLSANKTMLNNLEFNLKVSFSSMFAAPFQATNAADRNDATLTIPAFTAKDYLYGPTGATHFRLVHALGVVSDYVYNNATLQYEPIEPALNTLSAVSYSAHTPMVSATQATFTINTALPGAPTMDADVSVVQCVGIEFYQQIARVNYLLSQGNAMKVVRVF